MEVPVASAKGDRDDSGLGRGSDGIPVLMGGVARFPSPACSSSAAAAAGSGAADDVAMDCAAFVAGTGIGMGNDGSVDESTVIDAVASAE